MTQAWDKDVDVLVVGSGAGGMTAALCAADRGLDALLIEKSGKYGGTSAVSGGGIWVPCNEQMEKLGCADSFAEAKGYVELLTEGEVEPQRLDAYLKRATEMVHYMAERFSVRFKAISIYPDYFPHLPGGKPGYRTMEPEDFDAARLGEEFDNQRPPYPGTLMMGRIAMNQVEAHSMLCRTRGWVLLFLKLALRYWMDFGWRRRSRRDRRQVLGQGMVAALRHAMLRENVPLWLNTGLDELVTESGRVVGAVVNRDDRPMRIRARRAVVLACGGFESNQAMREQYLPAPTDRSWSIAPGINVGDGIQAGLKLGAGTRFMDLTWGTPSVVVPGSGWASGLFVERAFPHAIMVNGAGQRFCNEAGPYTEVVYSIYRDHQRTGNSVPCWFICDGDYRKKFPLGPIMPPAIQPDSKIPAEWDGEVYFKADTLEGLAERLGIAPEALRATVDRYNRMSERGIDEDFHKGENCFDTYYGDESVKPNPCMGPIARPPFYALKVLPGELGTKGGLDADHAGRVMREDGSTIEGLYAVGNCSAAVMGKTYPGPGSTLGPAMTFAYLAVEDIAAARQDSKIASAA